MVRFRWLAIGILWCALPTWLSAGGQRSYLNIVGSASVDTFSAKVIQRFVELSDYASPQVQSRGTGDGFVLFCKGVGVFEPDLNLASRRMQPAEYDRCHANGVDDIVEIKIGYDGIVLAGSMEMPIMYLGRDDIYKGLAQDVPSPNGGNELVANPYVTWKTVNPALPGRAIRVLGPPAGSGAHYLLTRLVMEPGCHSFGRVRILKSQDPSAYRDACRTIRDDEFYMAAGDNDKVSLARLLEDPQGLAIFGFGFLNRNRESIHAMAIDGVLPTRQTVSDNSYPLSRPLYLYVKKAHVGRFPGIEGFVAEFTSEQAWGDEGYLVDAGLVPLPADERQRYARVAAALKTMGRP